MRFVGIHQKRQAGRFRSDARGENFRFGLQHGVEQGGFSSLDHAHHRERKPGLFQILSENIQRTEFVFSDSDLALSVIQNLGGLYEKCFQIVSERCKFGYQAHR